MDEPNFKLDIIKIFKPYFELTENLIEIPPDPSMGDYAVPCFKMAKKFRKSPVSIAQDLINKIKLTKLFEKVETKGPYINFFVNKSIFAELVLKKIFKEKEKFGQTTQGNGRNIVIDYSSPNIAKPFGIAHIRSTVIGNSLYHIFSALGYKVIRVNHLGDWGTQFGKLMVAYRKWGDQSLLEKDGIHYLVKIYVEFGERAKEDHSLNDEARAWFKKLEDGDPEARKLWTLFREMSLKEFKKYYNELGVEFDYYQGEAFYNDQLEDTIKLVQEKIPTEISEGALIVNLKDKGIKVPLLLRKSDGATTYHTRDLAAALYRIRTFDPWKIMYVVGSPQALHFKQLFATLEKLGYNPEMFEHIPFGNMTYEGVMMSTRKGNFIELTEVLNKAVRLAKKIIEEKNPDLPNKEKTAHQVGIGAIIFGDLSNDRIRDVDFRWDKTLTFEGDTAPYLQYTHARICSILKKVEVEPTDDFDYSVIEDQHEILTIKKLEEFPKVIQDAARTYKPSIIANYLLELAQTFNKFYVHCRIKDMPDSILKARLLIADSTRIIIKKGLALLGIEAPNQM